MKNEYGLFDMKIFLYTLIMIIEISKGNLLYLSELFVLRELVGSFNRTF